MLVTLLFFARYTVLNLNGHLYIGGLPETVRTDAPAQVWAAGLRDDFVGCLGSLSIDGNPVDLTLESTALWARGFIRPGEKCLGEGTCLTSSKACSPGSCLAESWINPICDCADTNFAGELCKQGTLRIMLKYI